ncbi:ATP-dependent exoDNAse (exonuclease V) beta subunit [Arthrobacter sp. V1I9]|nr:ATP-dependent exoDNAse (exonuclease V) beta subunit [Arthrobacter sp. V1I9]
MNLNSAVARTTVPEPRFTPEELSVLLGEKNVPTPEQSAIISSPLTPRLVIAGAGSGKTATMADRVVWLVANGWVRPEEVLGVTFTRKAAR